MRRRVGLIAVVVILLPALLGASATPSLARLTDTLMTTGAMGTDTLDPPTTLAATGGPTAALTWVATTDTYASGYELQRATVSGGPFTVVSSVSARTTVATSDAPASGTYFYVLRSVFQNWRSVNSNQASAVTVTGPTPTGFKGCTAGSNGADTGGNGNGYESLPDNACSINSLSATDGNTGTTMTLSCTNPGKDRHRFWDFGLGVPLTASAINGIQVRADAGMNGNGGTSQLCVELSWNGGTTWTTPKTVTLTSSALTTYAFGATNDLWGRSPWAAADFANASFRVRMTDVTNQPNKSFLLEYLAVQVTYTP